MSDIEPTTPRPDGWKLVATREGTKGWHRIDEVNSQGSVTTVCGLVGRPIDENMRAIICCGECRSAENP